MRGPITSVPSANSTPRITYLNEAPIETHRSISGARHALSGKNPADRSKDGEEAQSGATRNEFGVREPAEFEGAFVAMAAKRVGAVVVIDDATLIANASAVARFAFQHRLPSSGWPDYAVAGGLIGYGVSFPDLFRRAATFVDKILKGVKPADLPVERATKFETIVNLKIAKALGLDVPTAILLRADEVIE